MNMKKTKQEIANSLSLLANKLRFGYSFADARGDTALRNDLRRRFNKLQALVYRAGGHVYDMGTHSIVELP